MAHDCNVLSCLGGSSGSRGRDPGRDSAANTADDLDLATVIQGLVDNNTVLIDFDSSGGGSDGGFTYAQIWNCWAGLTCGAAMPISLLPSVERDAVLK